VPICGWDLLWKSGRSQTGSARRAPSAPSPSLCTCCSRRSVGERRYNERIALTGIPEDAYRYQLGSRSALEWIIDRYCIKTDKTSGIVNDPNDWPWQVGDPRYLVDLVARIVTVSLEACKLSTQLPRLAVGEP
jgi:hypothetical protein